MKADVDWLKEIDASRGRDVLRVFDAWRIALPDRSPDTFPLVKEELAAFSRAFARHESA